MTDYSSRREFLKKIVLCAGACLTGEVLKEQEAWSKSKYKISDWTGDDFTVGHRLRDGKLPRLPKTAEKKVDVVIVGGGIAGLAAAHYLSDHDLLLLEQYDKTGGHARGASYQGIDYSIGSQYFTNMNGDLGELLNELGLEPVEIKKQKNSWYIDQQLVNESEANSEHTINQEMKKLHGELKKFNSIFTSDLLTDYKNNADLKKLDQISLDSYLKGYDPKFSALLNSYCKSSMCGGIKQISALSGLSLLDDLNLSTFVFPGGNQKVSRQLFSRLEKRAAQARETGAFVWSIDVHDNGASIVYSAGKRLTRVDCKHVIIAIPHMITSRITHGIDDKIKATLFSFRYGSYLVANLLLRKRIFKSNFDNWFAPPLDFADLTIAETPYLLADTYKEEMGSVLTVYQPYEAASIGRTVLFRGDRKAIAARLMEQMQKLCPELESHLDQIVLTRWGHGLAVPRSGYFEAIEKLQQSQGDAFSFAHSSAIGLPSIEAAVSAAKLAANRVKKKKTCVSPLYFVS